MRNIVPSLALWLLAAISSGTAFAANQAPTATLTAPAAGTIFYAPATITLSADAQDPDGTINKVEFLNGSTVIPNSADTSNPYSFTWTNVGPGTYSLKARATDNGSPQKTGDSPVVQITVVQLTTTILQPAANSTVSGKTVTVSGRFVGPTTTSITVTGSAGHSVVASISGDTYTAQGLELRPGTNVIEVAVARRDGTGETTSINVTAVEPPVVVVTGPLVCTQPAPATVTLTAEALSPQGQISAVQFLVDGVPVGTASAPPYSVSTTLSLVKTYEIKAIATDQYGSAQSVRPLYLTVQAPPPIATVTSPLTGTSFRLGTPITLAATASTPSGTVSSVRFYRATSTPIGNPITAPPYTLEWTDAPLGLHRITAVATNSLGVPGTSNEVSITVTQNSAPIVTITAPGNGATFNAPADVPIVASATDDGSIAEVEFFAGTQSLGKRTAAPYSLTWPNAPVGTHSLTARAKDNEGVTSTSAAVSITVDGVTAAITAPADGATFAAPAAFNLTASATTSSGTVTNVELLDGTQSLQTFNTNATTVDLNVAMSGVTAGPHSYTVKATDSGGRIATSPAVNVMVTAPASVTLTAPVAAAFYVSPATILLTANATAGSNPIAKVEFFTGATLIATVTSPPYQYTWMNAPVGGHTLAAKATDTANASVTSASVVINVASAPTVSVAAGIDGSSVADDRVLVSGTIQSGPNSSVTVKGQVAVVAANGQFFVNTVKLAPGVNSLPIIVATQDGVSATHTINVTSTATSPFSVAIEKALGIAPMSLDVHIANEGPATIGQVEYDTNDDGTPELISTNPNERVVLTYDTPGLRRLKVTIKDPQGAVLHTAVRNVLAVAPIERADLLAGVHREVMDRLAAGNINGAMNLLAPQAVDIYRDTFIAMGSNLAAAVAQFGSIRHVMLGDEVGQLVVVREGAGGPKAFMVNLLRGEDGIWRIEGM